MKKTLLLTSFILLITTGTHAQRNNSIVSLGAHYSFPFHNFYKNGLGANFQYNHSISERVSLYGEVSYTYFKHEETRFINVGYLNIKPGANFFLNDNFYLQAGAGPRLARRAKDIITEMPERILVLNGLAITGGAGYRKIYKSGSGYDIFINYNTGTTKNYIRSWLNAGVAYSFRISSKNQ